MTTISLPDDILAGLAARADLPEDADDATRIDAARTVARSLLSRAAGVPWPSRGRAPAHIPEDVAQLSAKQRAYMGRLLVAGVPRADAIARAAARVEGAPVAPAAPEGAVEIAVEIVPEGALEGAPEVASRRRKR